MLTDIPYHLALLAFSAVSLRVLYRRPRLVVLMAIAAWTAAVGWLAAEEGRADVLPFPARAGR